MKSSRIGYTASSQFWLTPIVDLTSRITEILLTSIEVVQVEMHWIAIPDIFRFRLNSFSVSNLIPRLGINQFWLKQLSIWSQFDSYVHLMHIYFWRRGWNFGPQLWKNVLLKFCPPDKIDRQIFFTVWLIFRRSILLWLFLILHHLKYFLLSKYMSIFY